MSEPVPRPKRRRRGKGEACRSVIVSLRITGPEADFLRDVWPDRSLGQIVYGILREHRSWPREGGPAGGSGVG